MRRGGRRAPSRKRKLGGRAKGGREPAAVNFFHRVASLPWVWASLRLREMVRSGPRPGQVLSSRRHTGPVKLTNGKKGTHLRKVSRFNADSGYPIHSDLENQSETVQGLDGCASLLRDILRNEDSGSETAYLENKYKSNSRTSEGKRCGSKKKGPENHTLPSAVWKEILSPDSKKQIPNEAPARNERDSSDIAQNQSLQDHYRMHSPMIYQALCEHVQTQMSLMNDLALKTSVNGIPVIPCHTVSRSESQATPHSSYGLPTSTPVLSPQRPPCLPVVHSQVQTDSDNQFASEGKTVLVNSADVPRNSFNSSPGVSCGLPRTDKSAIPVHQPLGLANGILPQQANSKEADLLKYFQAYMSLLHSPGKEAHLDSQTHKSPTRSQPAFLATNKEKCAREHIGKTTSEDLNIHVREAGTTKDVQKAKNVNQTTEKIRTIKYLLGELKSLVAEQGDSEIQRLVTEVETCISLLPEVSGNTNVQVEIALAMQPLRSENAQLRRQVRILNQQLRERENTQKTSSSLEGNLLKLFSLQSLNMSLQNQLQESLKSQELLQSKNEELLKVIENQKDENKKFASIFKEKDQTILENKQQFDIESTRMKIELEEALVNMKSSQFKLEASEKENQILGITLRQRDAEVTQLRELTRTLQSSMAKLLSDLSVDSACCKPGNNLTKSLLNIHEKQLRHDPIPTHTSIMSYLSKLETEHIFTHSEPLSTVKNEENMVPDRPYENVLPAKVLQHSNTKSVEEVSAPGIISAISKQGFEEKSETKTLTEDECNLDDTIYIPFVRSTPKKNSLLSKRISPQPQKNVATPQPITNGGFVSEKEKKLCAPIVCSSSEKEAEDAPEKLPTTADMEDRQLLKEIKEAIGKIPATTEESQEQVVCRGPSACQSNSLEMKGNTVSDGSFLNSDLMSDWSISSLSTFTSHDEQDFRNGLAALDANIARIQKSLRTGLLEK
ncbi:coiled-coil domain-containing protein 14 [Orycteropus afer afer]|uniref:Coiled-coil domain-containing protein 14 n=1 Tax=Orycteropus afer afer TaxID=1230840 RepID=A0AC54Z8W5_ORYAF|nr:coiled-coil domain-containing protein 14 [Orycteropus afer afer]